MKMSCEAFIKKLIDRGLIKQQEIHNDQIISLLERAKKDIVVAKKNLKIDEEASYTFAYLAMLRTGRAVMFLKGYRPVDGQQHKTVIEFCEMFMDKEFNELTKTFEIMRRKRNQFTYDPGIPISIAEAENALKISENFVDMNIESIKKKNPQLELNF
jgi:uncharacterized protein (UPF0332 family)